MVSHATSGGRAGDAGPSSFYFCLARPRLAASNPSCRSLGLGHHAAGWRAQDHPVARARGLWRGQGRPAVHGPQPWHHAGVTDRRVAAWVRHSWLCAVRGARCVPVRNAARNAWRGVATRPRNPPCAPPGARPPRQLLACHSAPRQGPRCGRLLADRPPRPPALTEGPRGLGGGCSVCTRACHSTHFDIGATFEKRGRRGICVTALAPGGLAAVAGMRNGGAPMFALRPTPHGCCFAGVWARFIGSCQSHSPRVAVLPFYRALWCVCACFARPPRLHHRRPDAH